MTEAIQTREVAYTDLDTIDDHLLFARYFQSDNGEMWAEERDWVRSAGCLSPGFGVIRHLDPGVGRPEEIARQDACRQGYARFSQPEAKDWETLDEWIRLDRWAMKNIRPWQMDPNEFAKATHQRWDILSKCALDWESEGFGLNALFVLANLRLGDRFTIAGAEWTVQKISDRMMILTDPNGDPYKITATRLLCGKVAWLEQMQSLLAPTPFFDRLEGVETILAREPLYQHRRIVRQAIRQGLSIPKRAVAAYPELQAKFFRSTSAGMQPAPAHYLSLPSVNLRSSGGETLDRKARAFRSRI